MKDVELRLISELMKNSRRSDRQLAKALGVSQPTVSRIIRKLEKEGYLGRYTLLPNFNKLGYKMLVITFVKARRAITPKEREKASALAGEVMKKGPFQIVMAERGIGLGYDGVFMSYHKDYSEYAGLIQWFKQLDSLGFFDVEATASFIVNLDDEVRYHPLDFATLAEHLIAKKEKKE